MEQKSPFNEDTVDSSVPKSAQPTEEVSLFLVVVMACVDMLIYSLIYL